MKIIRDGDGNITVQFEGVFGLRQAIGLPKLLKLFPAGAPVKLDFSRAECERESAMLALIPALSTMRHRQIDVVGLVAAAANAAHEGDVRKAA